MVCVVCLLVHNLQPCLDVGVVLVVFTELPISAVNRVLLNGIYRLTAVTESALTVGSPLAVCVAQSEHLAVSESHLQRGQPERHVLRL